MTTLLHSPYVILILYAVTVWRISYMFVNEAGPFKIFAHFRRIVAGIEADDMGLPAEIPPTNIADLLSCIWCFSVWVASALLATLLVMPNYFVYICLPFFGSAVAIWIDGKIRKY